MTHTTHLITLAAALAIAPHTFAQVDEIKRDFGPSQRQVLNVIRDFKHEPVTDRKRDDILPRKQRRFYNVEDYGTPSPVEDWKSVTWLVEGTWTHRPDTATNLCESCRNASPVLLSIHRWKVSKTALCPVCGAVSTFMHKRFAKMRLQYRIITYSRKDDESKLLKITRFRSQCLAVVDSFDALSSSGEWEEELSRKSKRDTEGFTMGKPQPSQGVADNP